MKLLTQRKYASMAGVWLEIFKIFVNVATKCNQHSFKFQTVPTSRCWYGGPPWYTVFEKSAFSALASRVDIDRLLLTERLNYAGNCSFTPNLTAKNIPYQPPY